MTRAELIRVIDACLNERLVVEAPRPYGDGVIVVADGDAVIVVQLGGPHYRVRVEECRLEVASRRSATGSGSSAARPASRSGSSPTVRLGRSRGRTCAGWRRASAPPSLRALVEIAEALDTTALHLLGAAGLRCPVCKRSPQ